MGRSKLKLALKAEKGQLDPKALREMKAQKKHKLHLKEKQRRGSNAAEAPVVRKKGDEEEEDDDEDEDGSDEEHSGDELLDLAAEEGESDEEEDDAEDEGMPDLDDSDTSESEVEFETKIERKKNPTTPAAAGKKTKKEAKKEAKKAPAEEDEDDEDEEDDDESVALSDLEDLAESDREDMIPHQRLRINNTSALKEALARIALPAGPSVPFAALQRVEAAGAPTADAIPDVHDDLQRELQFYAQALDAAKRARALLRAEGVPFARPADYFAEMVKADEQMEKVRAKLVEDATAKRAATEARKLRDLRKFGKQVQVAKLQERAKEKKVTLEKISALKRKRSQSGGDLGTKEADDLFDVAVDKELKSGGGGRDGGAGRDGGRRGAGRDAGGGPNPKRQKKNEKFGFGGRKRHAKSGDAASSGDMTGFSVNKMKGRVGTKGGAGKPSAARPGKSRRKAAALRR